MDTIDKLVENKFGKGLEPIIDNTPDKPEDNFYSWFKTACYESIDEAIGQTVKDIGKVRKYVKENPKAGTAFVGAMLIAGSATTVASMALAWPAVYALDNLFHKSDDKYGIIDWVKEKARSLYSGRQKTTEEKIIDQPIATPVDPPEEVIGIPKPIEDPLIGIPKPVDPAYKCPIKIQSGPKYTPA